MACVLLEVGQPSLALLNLDERGRTSQGESMTYRADVVSCRSIRHSSHQRLPSRLPSTIVRGSPIAARSEGAAAWLTGTE